MNDRENSVPLWRIFHPSDFTPPSAVAFAHALKLALITRSALTVFHVAPEMAETHWSEFPGVRDTLARWGLLPHGSSPESVGDLGIEVEKVIGVDSHPLRSIRRFIEIKLPDLIVLATHQHHGLDRWLHHAVAEPLAMDSGVLSLLVPPDVAGFVSLETGQTSLRRILVPIDRVPDAQPAVKGAAALAAALSGRDVQFELLHVGELAGAPAVDIPEGPGWQWELVERPGHPAEEILRSAHDGGIDLIVMTTHGHAGFLDAFRGTTTERVLRDTPCPVLAIPAGTRRLEAMLAES